MRLVFLPQSAQSLTWFRKYYEQVFPEGAIKAKTQFNAMKQVLLAHPFIGQQIEGRESRIYHISRTPFSVIYRLREDRIEVLTVFDNRSDPIRL
jgi:toxin ParE1/3/4